MIVSSLLPCIHQTLPSTGPGALTDAERADLLSKSIALAKWGYS